MSHEPGERYREGRFDFFRVESSGVFAKLTCKNPQRHTAWSVYSAHIDDSADLIVRNQKLFACFPDGGIAGVFAGFDMPAGKADFVRLAFQMRCTDLEEHLGSFFPWQQGNEYRGPT
jgi:tetrahydromethanopterin S-methyltransferase subunit F